MKIRKAGYEDIDEINNIYTDARAYMRASGNDKQWTGGYPALSDVKADIDKGELYVLVDKAKIACVFCCLDGKEPTYDKIYEGSWQNDKEYRAVHRIAVAKEFHGKGAAQICLDFALSFCGSVRIDTHRDNIPMQKMLTKHGFTYCGIIYLQNGDERFAYQKSINTEDAELIDIVDKNRNKTDKTEKRYYKTKDGEYKEIVHIAVFKDGKMLIQQRQYFKHGFPGFWDVSVGGTVISGENSRGAAQRELCEELGLKFDFSNREADKTVYFKTAFDDYYVINSDVDIDLLNLQSDEVRGVIWADKQRIYELLDYGVFVPYPKVLIDELFLIGQSKKPEKPGYCR